MPVNLARPRTERAGLINRHVPADMRHAPRVDQVSLFAPYPAPFRAGRFGQPWDRPPDCPQAGFRPAHAARHQVAGRRRLPRPPRRLTDEPLRCRRRKLVSLHNAGRPEKKLHLAVCAVRTQSWLGRSSTALRFWRLFLIDLTSRKPLSPAKSAKHSLAFGFFGDACFFFTRAMDSLCSEALVPRRSDFDRLDLGSK